MTTLTVRPYAVKHALAFNAEKHRRRPKLQGGMWAVAVERGGGVVGVAIVGRPCRVMDDGRTLVVTRCAAIEGDAAASGNKGACSMLYGRCARAAKAMGALLYTYTEDDEPGTSLRAAGWIDEGIQVDSDPIDRRPGRQLALHEPNRPKRRWRAP